MLRKKFMLVLGLVVLLVAAVPAAVLAAPGTFIATGVIDRTDPGTASLDLGTGLLTTLDQVFVGELSTSDWGPLDGADITVLQSSAIGADIFELATLGTTPLGGAAWGAFTVSSGADALSGSYFASIGGWLTVDPSCAPTDAFASAGIPFLPVRVDVVDLGGWTAIAGTPAGAYTAINELGGSLVASASGCLGDDESAVIIIAGALSDVGGGPADPLTCDGLAATIIGTPGNDRINGTPGDDVIVGLGGHDRVDGKGGNDVICGGADKDQLEGGDGEDRIFGGDDNDRIYGQDGNDYVEGGAGDDVVYGGTGDDELFGNEGNDRLKGEAGKDVVMGGSGKNTVQGGDDADVLFGGGEDDRLYGNDGDDIMLGGDGYNVYYGGDGDDTIIGGADRDRIKAGLGRDFCDGGGGGQDSAQKCETVVNVP
jgi:Ca2+-binding RTX toxin-like protein